MQGSKDNQKTEDECMLDVFEIGDRWLCRFRWKCKGVY